jgi:hypothetical protein
MNDDMSDVHSTRLCQKILEHFPDARAEPQGRMTVIVFNEGMEAMLKEALKKRDSTKEAQLLSQTATTIRKDILAHKTGCYTVKFEKNSQQDSYPASLDFLVSMIISGKNLKNQNHLSQVITTICQMIVFNVKKKVKDASHTRHTLEREPPLPMYLSLKIRSVTRSKGLVETFQKLLLIKE